jgi:hypothetical protein
MAYHHACPPHVEFESCHYNETHFNWRCQSVFVYLTFHHVLKKHTLYFNIVFTLSITPITHPLNFLPYQSNIFCSLVKWQVSQMANWWNGKWMNWQAAKMANWCSSKRMKWQVFELARWLNCKLTNLQVDEMVRWWKRKLTKANVFKMMGKLTK